jgi:hypothetical protein
LSPETEHTYSNIHHLADKSLLLPSFLDILCAVEALSVAAVPSADFAIAKSRELLSMLFGKEFAENHLKGQPLVFSSHYFPPSFHSIYADQVWMSMEIVSFCSLIFSVVRDADS